MQHNTTENTKQRHRIPVMGPDAMKETLSTASMEKGVSAGAIARKAMREWFERQTGDRICPACWETVDVKKGVPTWHIHNNRIVTGDMWW